MIKRGLGFFLAVLMILSMFPLSAFAISLDPMEYTITFSAGSGEGNSHSETYGVDEKCLLPDAEDLYFSYKDHTFSGWNIGGKTYRAGTSYTFSTSDGSKGSNGQYTVSAKAVWLSNSSSSAEKEIVASGYCGGDTTSAYDSTSKAYKNLWWKLDSEGTLTIGGQVAAPGTFPYAANTSIEDLIIQAGGLLDGASFARVDVTRRIKDNTAVKAQEQISQMFTLTVRDGFIIDSPDGFALEPYDVVYVRKSPSYVEPQTVTLAGEANFPGDYTLTKRNQRITELLAQGGGITDFAFVKGARLVRKITEIERQKMHEVYRQIFLGGDSLNNAAINLGNEYYVAIDLDKALENPGSKYDIVLRDSDRLEIPGELTHVRVSGAVQNPNTITYEEGKKVKYYIEQAGGYADHARKSHAFVLHMNGHITKARSTKHLDPGAEIVVPMKKKSPTSIAQTMAVATTSASLATALATVANIIRK